MLVQLYIFTKSLESSVLNAVKLIVIWAAPAGAMIHSQKELLE
jgi:hypothetical protein